MQKKIGFSLVERLMANWQLERGVTSEISLLLAMAYANQGGIPPNRAHKALPLWPGILKISRWNPDTKKRDILLNLGPRMGQNRSISAVQPSCTGCAR